MDDPLIRDKQSKQKYNIQATGIICPKFLMAILLYAPHLRNKS